jgi:hypothetical protein
VAKATEDRGQHPDSLVSLKARSRRRDGRDGRRLVLGNDELECRAQMAFLRAIEKHLPPRAIQQLKDMPGMDAWNGFRGHHRWWAWKPWQLPRSDSQSLAPFEAWATEWNILATCVVWWAHFVAFVWSNWGSCPQFPLPLIVPPDYLMPVFMLKRPEMTQLPFPNPESESREIYQQKAGILWDQCADWLRSLGAKPLVRLPELENHCDWVALRRIHGVSRASIAMRSQNPTLDPRSISRAIARVERLVGLR